MPTRSFGLVDYKVREAEYFLLDLRRVGQALNFPAVQYCSTAFAAAARSVTFAMQASLNDHPDFGPWYTTQQQELRDNSLARFFHEYRRVTQHIGEQVVSGGTYRDGGAKYLFLPTADLPRVPEDDVESCCEAYFKLVLSVVYNCYVVFGPIVDGQQRYTSEFFQSIGKSIEDAEEELGFPRGWTDLGEPGIEAYRWEALRQQADGCGIEEQFANWLGLHLPRVSPLPPFASTDDA